MGHARARASADSTPACLSSACASLYLPVTCCVRVCAGLSMVSAGASSTCASSLPPRTRRASSAVRAPALTARCEHGRALLCGARGRRCPAHTPSPAWPGVCASLRRPAASCTGAQEPWPARLPAPALPTSSSGAPAAAPALAGLPHQLPPKLSPFGAQVSACVVSSARRRQERASRLAPVAPCALDGGGWAALAPALAPGVPGPASGRHRATSSRPAAAGCAAHNMQSPIVHVKAATELPKFNL